MSIRDVELQRLEKYAQGMGIRVSYRKYKKGTTLAEWHEDGKLIVLYTYVGQSKTRLILNFIHELGHHLDWIYNDRKNNPQLIEALNADNPTKEQRKLIYEDELNATKYREFIVKEVDIKLKSRIIEQDINLDKFVYKYYYENGKFPTYKLINKYKQGCF